MITNNHMQRFEYKIISSNPTSLFFIIIIGMLSILILTHSMTFIMYNETGSSSFILGYLFGGNHIVLDLFNMEFRIYIDNFIVTLLNTLCVVILYLALKGYLIYKQDNL